MLSIEIVFKISRFLSNTAGEKSAIFKKDIVPIKRNTDTERANTHQLYLFINHQ